MSISSAAGQSIPRRIMRKHPTTGMATALHNLILTIMIMFEPITSHQAQRNSITMMIDSRPVSQVKQSTISRPIITLKIYTLLC
jgi:hypothetical protein